MPVLKKIFVMTLERQDRVPYCLGSLSVNNTPMEIVEPVYGKDDHAYEKGRDVCDDAIRDGFEAFAHILEGGHHNTHPIGYLAQRWNYLRLFRRIAESDQPALILQDDYTFNPDPETHFWEFDALVLDFLERGGFMNAIFGINAPRFPRETYANKLELLKRYSRYMLFCPLLVGNNDVAVLMSPEGAQWMIDTVTQLPAPNNFQNCLSEIWESGMDQPQGNYTTLLSPFHNIFRDAFQTKYQPSTIHTTNYDWLVSRTPTDTSDDDVTVEEVNGQWTVV